MADKNYCTVGFDTSNYTTSAAVCSLDGNVLLNLKLPLPVKPGERGLRQSDAVYAHVKNQPQLMTLLSRFLRENRLTPIAAAYSASPTTGEASFMPLPRHFPQLSRFPSIHIRTRKGILRQRYIRQPDLLT